MKKTILFIASMDTKQKEIEYARHIAEASGCNTLVADTSTRMLLEKVADFTPVDILAFKNVTWSEFEKLDKGERIEMMARCSILYIQNLYKEGRFNGVMSIGGGQNSKMASDVMKKLPYGVPKLVVSTLASGKRNFDLYIGHKDILVMHSVIDIAGLNSIANMIINNAVAAMVGMVEKGMLLPSTKDKKRIAATMLGITTKGATRVIAEMEHEGYEMIGFHANGVGGVCMEELIDNDFFDMILDLNLHEITCELYDGFCSGAVGRLILASQKAMPQIIVPGAIDVLDYAVTSDNKKNILDMIEGRKYYFHNSTIIHAKINALEAYDLATIVSERLNLSTGRITVLLPLNGFCEAGAEGGILADKQIDGLFVKVLKDKLNKSIKIIEVNANINDDVFCDAIVEEANLLLNELVVH